jgi:hypothetical protein
MMMRGCERVEARVVDETFTKIGACGTGSVPDSARFAQRN